MVSESGDVQKGGIEQVEERGEGSKVEEEQGDKEEGWNMCLFGNLKLLSFVSGNMWLICCVFSETFKNSDGVSKSDEKLDVNEEESKGTEGEVEKGNDDGVDGNDGEKKTDEDVEEEGEKVDGKIMYIF